MNRKPKDRTEHEYHDFPEDAIIDGIDTERALARQVKQILQTLSPEEHAVVERRFRGRSKAEAVAFLKKEAPHEDTD